MAESSRSRENKSHEAEALNDCNKIKRKNTRGQRLSIDDGNVLYLLVILHSCSAVFVSSKVMGPVCIQIRVVGAGAFI